MNSQFIILATLALFSAVGSVGANEVSAAFKDHRAVIFAETQSFNCTPGPESAECDYSGTCTTDGSSCICDSGHITFESDGSVQCNYKQKSSLAAFLLQFFLGVEGGAGYFYLGKTVLGVGQLLLFWLGLIPVCLIMCGVMGSSASGSDGVAACCGCLGVLYTICWVCGTLAWQIYALVQIGTGNELDGNGAPTPGL